MTLRQIQPNNEVVGMNIKIQTSFENSIKLVTRNISVISDGDLEFYVPIVH